MIVDAKSYHETFLASKALLKKLTVLLTLHIILPITRLELQFLISIVLCFCSMEGVMLIEDGSQTRNAAIGRDVRPVEQM